MNAAPRDRPIKVRVITGLPQDSESSDHPKVSSRVAAHIDPEINDPVPIPWK